MSFKVLNINVHNNDIGDKILPLLLNKVFHVTSQSAFNLIEKDYKIKNNKENVFDYVFGPQSENSYGRKRGYICLMDLRSKNTKQIEEALFKLSFLNPFRKDKGNPFYLIASPSIYPDLIDSIHAQKEVGLSEMWVPEVECWYPNNLSLGKIDLVIKTNIDYSTNETITEEVLKLKSKVNKIFTKRKLDGEIQKKLTSGCLHQDKSESLK